MPLAPVAMLERAAAAVIALLVRPGVFLAFMAAYYLLVAILTATLYTGASVDTTEQMMFAQVWTHTYDDANPPLFSWLVKAAALVLGPSAAPVLLVKFGCLWTMHAALHALARALRLTPALIVLTALSPLTLYYLAWDATYTYSHSLLLTAATCAAAWAAAVLFARPDPLRFALLGVILGIGLLAKYNFGLFALGLVGALALHPALRGRRGWLALTLLCLAPSLVLMAFDADRLRAGANDRLAISRDADLASIAAELLPPALEATWQFLLPALPLYVLVFWRALLTRPDRPIPPVVGTLGWALLASAVVMLVGLVAAHATTVRTPYVFIFVLVPVLLVLRLAGYSRLERAVRLFVLVPLAIMLVVPPAVAVKAAVEAGSCRRCFLAFDYAALADQLRRSGFVAGTMVGRLDDQGRIGGLRPHFPDSRLISLRYPDFVPPDRPGGDGQCALVWYTPANVGDPAAALAAYAADVLASPPPDAPPRVFDIPLGSNGSRSIRVHALIWSPKAGRCR